MKPSEAVGRFPECHHGWCYVTVCGGVHIRGCGDMKPLVSLTENHHHCLHRWTMTGILTTPSKAVLGRCTCVLPATGRVTTPHSPPWALGQKKQVRGRGCTGWDHTLCEPLWPSVSSWAPKGLLPHTLEVSSQIKVPHGHGPRKTLGESLRSSSGSGGPSGIGLQLHLSSLCLHLLMVSSSVCVPVSHALMFTLASVIFSHLGDMCRDRLLGKWGHIQRDQELRFVTDLLGGHHLIHNRWQTECHRGDCAQSLHRHLPFPTLYYFAEISGIVSWKYSVGHTVDQTQFLDFFLCESVQRYIIRTFNRTLNT